MRYVIAGGSIAAHTAYWQIKKLDPLSEITVISRESTQPYSKMLLPYLLHSKNVRENMFFEVTPKDILLNERVTGISTENKTVTTHTGKTIPFDKLLIATGADAYIPDFQGEYEKEAIVGVRYLKDMEILQKRIEGYGNRNVVLLGAGLVTLEVGWALVQMGYSVEYVVRSSRILSQILDKEAADAVEAYIEKNFPVRFLKGEDVDYIQQKGSELEITLTGGERLHASAVVVGKGVKPNIDFLENSPINLNRGVVVNNRLMTNIEDIYAVGDVAAFDDVVDKEKKIHAIWPVAVEQAKAAAKNMAGMKTWYMPEFSRNALPVFNITIFTGGISNRDDFDVYKKTDGLEYRKVILKDGALVGFIIIGDVMNYGAYTLLAKKRVNVKDKIHQLLFGTITTNEKAYLKR